MKAICSRMIVDRHGSSEVPPRSNSSVGCMICLHATFHEPTDKCVGLCKSHITEDDRWDGYSCVEAKREEE
jgi:hypothetical protein